MDRNFQRALKLVLKHEGGWSDHPSDPGGATMKGVTIGTFRAYVKPNATKADLRAITDEQLATVYRRHYWDAVAGAELPDGVDYAVFDFAVNSGPKRAAQYLQGVVHASQDGRIGPATLRAVRGIPHAKVINDLCDARLSFLKRLKTWSTFGKGWSNRVSGVRSEALKMISQQAPKPTPAPKPLPPVDDPVVSVPAASKKETKKEAKKGKAPLIGFVLLVLSGLAAWFGLG